MRITRLELTNFRTFSHLVLEDIPDTVVLVSPNGLGKSSILEAIAGAHDLVTPYYHDSYPFRENVQGAVWEVWPNHLRKPVKFGAEQARISIEVQANPQEQAFLRQKGVEVSTGSAHFVIQDSRAVVESQADPLIKELFKYHNPITGIGYLDYIPAIRIYPDQGVGDLNSAGSDQQNKEIISSFHRNRTDISGKFANFKTFVVSAMLDDLTESRVKGNEVDSLDIFREVFNRFFSPKRFLGPKKSSHGGSVDVLVQTLFGPHDTDSLSDGEKEILNIMAHLYRFRELENILLWDTPESNLNAALESRLYDSLRKIAPNNQYWIASHSLEFIGSVPIENLFVIKSNGNGLYIERSNDPTRANKVKIYRELGAEVGLQLVSSVVVFVEGKEAESDKRILDRLIGSQIPAVNLFAGGDCDTILALGTRANNLLQDASTNGDFLAVVDRDYRDDAEMERVTREYCGRVFMWDVHEIENILLQPKIVYETLKFNDELGSFLNEEDVMRAIRHKAEELREWIAADWVRWEIQQGFKRPSGKIAPDSPFESLQEYGQRVREQGEKLAASASVDEKYKAKLTEIDRFLTNGQWLKRLPGKEILSSFLSEHTALGSKKYLKNAVSIVLEKEIEMNEIERLKSVLRASIGRR